MTVWTDNVTDFASKTETDGLDAYLDIVIANNLTIAAGHYADHRPGRGLFTIERLRARLERLEASQEQPRRRHTPVVVYLMHRTISTNSTTGED